MTPFGADGRVDLGALERLAHDVLDAGAAGIVALATTAEASSLDADERALVVSACARVCEQRGAPLVVGAGTNDTRTTIDRHAALVDVAPAIASLAVVPYYVRPSEDAVVRHFQAVAERSPVPLVVYNIPYRTGRGLGVDALLELARTDNVAGVKQAVGVVDADTLRLLAEAPDDFAVLAGDDPFICPLVLLGAPGAIAASAQLATADFVAMVDSALAGGAADARARAAALLPLVTSLFAEPSPAVLKAVLHADGRIPTARVRMPLADASPRALERALAARA